MPKFMSLKNLGVKVTNCPLSTGSFRLVLSTHRPGGSNDDKNSYCAELEAPLLRWRILICLIITTLLGSRCSLFPYYRRWIQGLRTWNCSVETHRKVWFYYSKKPGPSVLFILKHNLFFLQTEKKATLRTNHTSVGLLSAWSLVKHGHTQRLSYIISKRAWFWSKLNDACALHGTSESLRATTHPHPPPRPPRYNLGGSTCQGRNRYRQQLTPGARACLGTARMPAGCGILAEVAVIWERILRCFWDRQP